MIAKILSIFLLAFSALLSSFNLLAEVHTSDALMPQAQSYYCAEDETEEEEEQDGEEEEPDCD